MDGAWWSGSFLLPFSAPRSRRDRHALARPPRAKPLLPPIDAPVCHCLAAFAFTGFRDATRRGAAAAKPQEITGGGGGDQARGGRKRWFLRSVSRPCSRRGVCLFPGGGVDSSVETWPGAARARVLVLSRFVSSRLVSSCCFWASLSRLMIRSYYT